MRNIYIVQHLVVNPPPLSLELYDEPKENFIRLSGDVLFDSVSKVFGEFCVAVILSGIARDVAYGAGAVKAGKEPSLLYFRKPFISFYVLSSFFDGECMRSSWHDWESDNPSSYSSE